MRARILAAVLALAAGIGVASAQPASEAQREAFGALLERALADFRVGFNCMALDPRGAESIAKTWRGTVTDTVPILQEAGYSAAEIIAFTERTDERRLMMGDRPFSEVIGFCHANQEWMVRFMRFEITFLSREAERIFSDDGAAPRR